PRAVVDQPVRERHDRAVHPSLAGQAPGAGRAGVAHPRAPARDLCRRGAGADAARPRNRHDPDRSRHCNSVHAPGLRRSALHLADRRASPRDAFSTPAALGYGWRMNGRKNVGVLAGVTVVAIAASAVLAFATIDPPPLPVKHRKVSVVAAVPATASKNEPKAEPKSEPKSEPKAE